MHHNARFQNILHAYYNPNRISLALKTDTQIEWHETEICVGNLLFYRNFLLVLSVLLFVFFVMKPCFAKYFLHICNDHVIFTLNSVNMVQIFVYQAFFACQGQSHLVVVHNPLNLLLSSLVFSGWLLYRYS